MTINFETNKGGKMKTNFETFEFDQKKIIEHAGTFEKVETQLAYLCHCVIIYRQYVQNYNYDIWAFYENEKGKLDYGDVDLGDGCTMSEKLMEDYQIEKAQLQWRYKEFMEDILPHIKMRSWVLQIPDKFKAEVPVIKRNEPIKWTGKLTQLIYLLEEMRRNGFLSQVTDTACIIGRHFIDESGKPFKNIPQMCRNVQQNKGGKCRKAKQLDGFIVNTKKKK